MVFRGGGSAAFLDEISRKLVDGLPPDKLSDPNAKYALWTAVITNRLCEMGASQGFLACGHGAKDNGEWLLDVVWMRREGHEVVLAVESEWGKPGDVEDDFDKLMSIKAQFKLLFFGVKSNKCSEMIKRLELLLRKYPYHLEGEEYLAVNVAKECATRYHFLVPPCNGVLDAVNFREIPSLSWPWHNS